MSFSSDFEVLDTTLVPDFDDTLDEVFWGEVTEKERLIVENDSKQWSIALSRALNESLDDIQEVDVERDSSLVSRAVSVTNELYDIQEENEESFVSANDSIACLSQTIEQSLNDTFTICDKTIAAEVTIDNMECFDENKVSSTPYWNALIINDCDDYRSDDNSFVDRSINICTNQTDIHNYCEPSAEMNAFIATNVEMCDNNDDHIDDYVDSSSDETVSKLNVTFDCSPKQVCSDSQTGENHNEWSISDSMMSFELHEKNLMSPFVTKRSDRKVFACESPENDKPLDGTEPLINFSFLNSTNKYNKINTSLIRNQSTLTKQKRAHKNLISPFVPNSATPLVNKHLSSLRKKRLEQSLSTPSQALINFGSPLNNSRTVQSNTKTVTPVVRNQSTLSKKKRTQENLLSPFEPLIDQSLNNCKQNNIETPNRPNNNQLLNGEQNNNTTPNRPNTVTPLISMTPNRPNSFTPLTSKQLLLSNKKRTEEILISPFAPKIVKPLVNKHLSVSKKKRVEENVCTPSQPLISFGSAQKKYPTVERNTRTVTPMVRKLSSVSKRKRSEENLLSPFMAKNTEKGSMVSEKQEKRDSSLGLLNSSLINFSAVLTDDENQSNTQNMKFLNPD